MGHGVGWLLLTAAAGYWVLERASGQQKKDVKRVGRLLGGTIIVLSLAGVACQLWCMTSGNAASCGFMGKRGWKFSCPFAGKEMPVSRPGAPE
jgi:hypothetical protein